VNKKVFKIFSPVLVSIALLIPWLAQAYKPTLGAEMDAHALGFFADSQPGGAWFWCAALMKYCCASHQLATAGTSVSMGFAAALRVAVRK